MTGTEPKDDLIDDVRDEIVGIAREGMSHPSTKPVLKGAAIGAVAGLILPVVTLPIGLVAGAGYMLYKRVRPS
jgi:di/tricarboxylate transporter